jgi:hypothetical protein
MRESLIVACAAIAAGCFALAGIAMVRLVYRLVIAYRAMNREPRTEPVSPVPTTPPAGGLRVHLVPPAEGPAPTTPDQPDECETSSTDEPAREESGADAGFAVDLAGTLWWERRLTLLVNELAAEGIQLNILDPVERAIAEDTLRMRLAVFEGLVHFCDRMAGLDEHLDRFVAWLPPEWIALRAAAAEGEPVKPESVPDWRTYQPAPAPVAHDFDEAMALATGELEPVR